MSMRNCQKAHYRRLSDTRRNQRRLQLRNIAAMILIFTGLVILAAFPAMFTAMAEEDSKMQGPYYKSIQIQEGDNLWNIAGRYRDGSPMTTIQYVEELKSVNGLRDDTIHTGEYLTVVYYTEVE